MKDFAQLQAEINAAIPLPEAGDVPAKVTAAGLNALLQSLAREISAAPDTTRLEFVFEAEFADEITRTLGSFQAATYGTEQRQNVASVAYVVNQVPVTLPFTVGAGDELHVRITRTSPTQAALVTLQN